MPVQAIYEQGRIYRVESDRLVGIDVEHVRDQFAADGTFSVLVRSPALEAGDRVVTTQLPRAITGLLVEPIDAAAMESALAGPLAE